MNAVRFFVRLYKKLEGILAYVERFLCEMTENMQVQYVLSRQALINQWFLKSEALKLSDEIGVKKAAEQLGLHYNTIAEWKAFLQR